MTYEPTTWKSGDVVTSAKLNKLENGVAAAGGMFVMHETVVEGTATLDANYNQVSAAIEAGQLPVILKGNKYGGFDILYVDSTVAQAQNYGITVGKTSFYAAKSATDLLTAAGTPK